VIVLSVMNRLQFRVQDHLIVPFGCPKWGIEKIRVVGVSTKATYFESDVPLAQIDRTAKKPLRLTDVRSVFPWDLPNDIEDNDLALDFVRDVLKKRCEAGTDFECRFLDFYFAECKRRVESMIRVSASPPDRSLVWSALLPLPQAHLYVEDPFSETFSYVPEDMRKVDFAFWTGQRFIAVEIDGSSHLGSEEHIRKDRALQRAGVLVIHILNKELLEHGQRVVEKLIPREVTMPEVAGKNEWNPLACPL
jgi:Protein of unknown function (DUF559)